MLFSLLWVSQSSTSLSWTCVIIPVFFRCDLNTNPKFVHCTLIIFLLLIFRYLMLLQVFPCSSRTPYQNVLGSLYICGRELIIFSHCSFSSVLALSFSICWKSWQWWYRVYFHPVSVSGGYPVGGAFEFIISWMKSGYDKCYLMYLWWRLLLHPMSVMPDLFLQYISTRFVLCLHFLHVFVPPTASPPSLPCLTPQLHPLHVCSPHFF